MPSTDASLVTAIWQAVAELGFAGGQVLEPGCGSGRFLAFAPDGAQPRPGSRWSRSPPPSPPSCTCTQILHESFADTHTPDGTFDLAIGNVPFGDVVLHGRATTAAAPSTTISCSRRCGWFAPAAWSSRSPRCPPWTVRVRRMHGRRWPTWPTWSVRCGCRAAGRRPVVTDVLILQRRDPDTAGLDAGWVDTQEVTFGEHTVAVNSFWVQHPELVLGTMGASNLYRDGKPS